MSDQFDWIGLTNVHRDAFLIKQHQSPLGMEKNQATLEIRIRTRIEYDAVHRVEIGDPGHGGRARIGSPNPNVTSPDPAMDTILKQPTRNSLEKIFRMIGRSKDLIDLS
jgi:hypothetical protein